MKLASYVADGAPAYGVVNDDGVITMNNRFGGRAASLRDALAGADDACHVDQPLVDAADAGKGGDEQDV